MRLPTEDSVLLNVSRVLAEDPTPLVLAVSGGCDSMALLHAVHRLAPERIAAVATFDHGTGPAASSAVELVCTECERLGVKVLPGAADLSWGSEAEWRETRWAFLHGAAYAFDARVATAHTFDDHIETVLMRVLRGSGARGLAGLLATSEVVRPFLFATRYEVRSYAWDAGVPFVEDPSNESRRFLRNRVRHDLLPALCAARPHLYEELALLSQSAAEVRKGVERVAESVSEVNVWRGVAVATEALRGYSREALAVLWPAIAARIEVTLDRRGTERIAGFTSSKARPGSHIQVSGGLEVYRRHAEFELSNFSGPDVEEEVLDGSPVRFDDWELTPSAGSDASVWTASLPRNSRLVVRRWRPGDRLLAAGATQPRRVKRFLSDAGIVGPHRSRWPVVEADGEVVWIPGVRRSDAATARSGRPEVSYTCEFYDRI